MEKGVYTILENTALTPAVWKMVLRGSTEALRAPGQFINIKLDHYYLRRPISVCSWDRTTITICYKVVGQGTEAMAALQPGQSLDILTGLGNGYDTAPSGDRPLLIGGGVGIPPLYALCRKLILEGKAPHVVLGFNTASELFLTDAFSSLLEGTDGQLRIATADGSAYEKGFVTDLIPSLDYTYFYACGPMPMFRAVEQTVISDGQYSFEERMGCGFGACMGCSVETKNGPKRICRDGPVLQRGEILW